MIYAKINEDGSCAGFYDPAFAKPPQGAVQITPEQHLQWLQKQSGLLWRNGKLVDAPAPPPPPAAAPASPRSPAELQETIKQLRDELDQLQQQADALHHAAPPAV